MFYNIKILRCLARYIMIEQCAQGIGPPLYYDKTCIVSILRCYPPVLNQCNGSFISVCIILQNAIEKSGSLVTHIQQYCEVTMVFYGRFFTTQYSLKKLSHYGISRNALRWFTSYLTDRKQYVKIDTIASTQQMITTGVPQGSILGPFSFLIYVNDLPQCSSLFDFVLMTPRCSLLSNTHSQSNPLTKTMKSMMNCNK